ncbi:MAG: hypothetical protein ISS79_10120, partial [Phycisphaerae bacterium]|nr:hypothetical protein [Phycisphaerae bacterium]
MKKALITIAVLLAAAVLLTAIGCKQEEQAPTGDPNDPNGAKPVKYRIAVIPKGTTHIFWK